MCFDMFYNPNRNLGCYMRESIPPFYEGNSMGTHFTGFEELRAIYDGYSHPINCDPCPNLQDILQTMHTAGYYDLACPNAIIDCTKYNMIDLYIDDPHERLKHGSEMPSFKETLKELQNMNRDRILAPLLQENEGILQYNIKTKPGLSFCQEEDTIEINISKDNSHIFSFDGTCSRFITALSINNIIKILNFHCDGNNCKAGSITIAINGIMKERLKVGMKTTMYIVLYKRKNKGFLGIYDASSSVRKYSILAYLNDKRLKELDSIYGGISINNDENSTTADSNITTTYYL